MYVIMLFIVLQIMAAHVFQRRLQNEGITFSTLHPGSVSGYIASLSYSLESCVCSFLFPKVNTGIVQGASDLKLLSFLFGGVKWSEFTVL